MRETHRIPGASEATANGECPNCKMPVPLLRAVLLGRGRPFRCKGCGRTLRIDKSGAGLAVAAFAAASILGKMFGFFAVVGVLIVLVIYEWLTVRVRLAGEGAGAPQ